MAIKLENKVNTEAPSVAYPFGNIKDNTGSNNGTPVDKNVYADFHQFFAKMMSESGIAYNDLPDNNTDGFQYWLALLENIKKTASFYTDITGSISLHPSFSAATVVARKYNDDSILLRVNATISSNIITGSDIITGLPSGSGASYFTAYFRNPLGDEIVPGVVQLLSNKIRNPTAINVATYDRFYLYMIYKAE